MTRHRLGDIGRLAVLLDQLRDIPALSYRDSTERWFQEILKDLTEYKEGGFGAIEEDCDTKLWKLLCDISEIKDKIYECLEIAEGEDRLNVTDDGKHVEKW